MKLPEIKKPDIKLPKLDKDKFDFKVSDSTMTKLWTGGTAICLACSGIALIVAMF